MAVSSDQRTVHIVLDSPLPPERVLATVVDFSDRRENVFPAVSVKHTTVHELGATSADVTEGTRAGPAFNWERCDYDWSRPGSVTATVTDSNIYALPSSWTLTATATPGGSRVEMSWVREFRRGPKGRLFGFVFRHFGDRLFGKYARQIMDNIELVATSSAPRAHSQDG
jgi:hypothetical protein